MPVVGTLFINANKASSAALKGPHVAVLPSIAGMNQTVEADFTSIQDNNPAPRFGLVLRHHQNAQSAQNYYLVSRLAGGTTGLRISRIVNGVETVLKHVPAPNPVPGTAFRLKGSISGNVLTLDLDGVPKVSASRPDCPIRVGQRGTLHRHRFGPEPIVRRRQLLSVGRIAPGEVSGGAGACHAISACCKRS